MTVLDPLPGPDDDWPDDDDLDAGDADPEPEPEPRASDWQDHGGPAPLDNLAPESEPFFAPDPRPGKVGKTAAKGKRGAAPRVTVATRKDIEAKFGLMLEVPGRIWQARDPLCGGAFVQQAPAIREAALELILQSPDLVAWFTGVGGGFMLWLNLMMACQPVAMMVYAHHIAHSIELPEGEQAAARSYAA